MKLAVSNIAWPPERDEDVARLLRDLGVQGIEVAPTKCFPQPLAATDAEIAEYRSRWERHGLTIVSAQALLFGKPELTIFDNPITRRSTMEYLAGICRLCGKLGAKPLVFGSPKNRKVGTLDKMIAWQIAVDFFRELGEIAHAHGTIIAMEANPAEYGADFCTSANPALQLVRDVDRPGFKLHLDIACMTMAEDDVAKIVKNAGADLVHAHASEPQLAPIGHGNSKHRVFAEALKSIQYSGWVSIEMRQPEPFDLDQLRQSIERVKTEYGQS